MRPARALLAVFVGLALAACTDELCKSEPTTLHLEVKSRGFLRIEAIRSLEVRMTIGGQEGGEERVRIFNVAGELDDDLTTIGIQFDTTAPTEVMIHVGAYDDVEAHGVYQGEASATTTLQPDGCNTLSMQLVIAPLPDAGVRDAGDAGDAGIGGDAAVLEDTGLMDSGSMDSGPMDSGDFDGGASFTYVPSNFDPTAIPTGGAIELNCGESELDTDHPSFDTWCGGAPEPTTITQGSGPEALVVSMSSLTIAAGSSLTIHGSRAAILAVFGPAVIRGSLKSDASGSTGGAGASHDESCAGSFGANGSSQGGGGGGGFGRDGAAGGSGMGSAGLAGGTDRLIPLRGGCRGGNGTGIEPTAGGGGGGAIQLSASQTLIVDGTIRAGGGGGTGAPRRTGGGGGGSGGAIFLEAKWVSIAAGAVVVANGGGGGGGGSDESNDPRAIDGAGGTVMIALGGAQSGRGGAGGNGGVEGTDAKVGEMAGNGGGGGGGGSVGRARLHSPHMCMIDPDATLSPAPYVTCP